MSEIEIVQAPALFALTNIHHAFFTRRGGVSEGIYAGLNAGPGSGDDPAAVAENRRRGAAHFDQPPENLLTAYQVHSPKVVAATGPFGEARPEVDGVVTARRGLICGVLSADCAPVLLADETARVVGAAHAGWRGALDGVVEGAVAEMETLGARRARIVAAVGPCIGRESYEVGPEFFERFARADAAFERFFTPAREGGKRRFDLPAFVLDRLAAAGVEAAAWVGRDTYAEPELFYSNRRALHRGERDYGRLLSAIMLS
jgi:hypothetical protein